MSDLDLSLPLSRTTTSSPSQQHLLTKKTKLMVHLNHQRDLSEKKVNCPTKIEQSSPTNKHNETSLFIEKRDPES